MIPVAMTIAGSDPSGGAGIQADLKTFSALKVYGMSAITALTVQNTQRVSNIVDVPAAIVAEQIDAAVSDIRPNAVKTGMLLNEANIHAAAEKIRQHSLSNLVIDPVMTSTSGTKLLESSALDALRRVLLPLAVVVTPNLEEAEILAGTRDLEKAARVIHAMGAQHVYIKGGHLAGPAVDLFFDGAEFQRLTADRILINDTHGTGCVTSAAITAYLARGESIHNAIRLAKVFITEAIRGGLRLGSGRGPCDPLGLARKGE